MGFLPIASYFHGLSSECFDLPEQLLSAFYFFLFLICSASSSEMNFMVFMT